LFYILDIIIFFLLLVVREAIQIHIFSW